MKVLLATDGMPAATYALGQACRLLALRDAQVYLVAITDPSLRIGANEDAERDLEQGAALLRERGISCTSLRRRGEFAPEIVAAARELGADLIVMGSGPRGRLARFLSGSTVDSVLSAWTGATLVIRHPESLDR